MMEIVKEAWTCLQDSWGTIILLGGYVLGIFSFYKKIQEVKKLKADNDQRSSRIEKMKLEIEKLNAEKDQRDSRIERVSLTDIAKYAPKSSAFDDVR